jgi:membrane fusion protein, heavy metal efflux system
MKTMNPTAPVEDSTTQPNSGTPPSASPSRVETSAKSPHSSPHSSTGRKILIGLLSLGIVVSLAAFGGYLSGARARDADAANPAGSGSAKGEKKKTNAGEKNPLPGVSLARDKDDKIIPHTVAVPVDVRKALGIWKGGQDVLAVAQAPKEMAPLVLPGSTALDPIHLARIRARFAPARVVKIGEVQDYSVYGQTSFARELRPGDRVKKGDVLGIFYSVDIGSKKNDLLDALTQLELDQKVLEMCYKHLDSCPEIMLVTQERQVQTDRNQVSRALNNLEAWDIPQNEIDALHEEAKKCAADKEYWKKHTREGRWVSGEKTAPTAADKIDPDKNAENPWGRATLRAPFDGIIVERNVSKDEMVVDNTVNLFQIAKVDKLLVIANCPEDQLPVLEALAADRRHWTVRTAGASDVGLPGKIDEVGYLIDPNQHTAIIKGYVENPGEHLRAGQYITATVPIPPPSGVVEIPMTSLMDDGQQSLVFVEKKDPKDPNITEYTMRRVQVTNRFDQKAFIRSTPIPKAERLTAREAEEGLLPKEPLLPNERILRSGTGELHMAILVLEAQLLKESHQDKP